MASPARTPQVRDVRFYARALVFFGLIAAVAAGVLYAVFFYDPAVNLNPGNPLSRAMTSKERAAEQEPYRAARARRKELADQVVNGDISFEQAACEYKDRIWDDESGSCISKEADGNNP